MRETSLARRKKQSRCSKKCHSDKKSILISGKTVAARQLPPRAVSLPVTKSIVTLMSVVQQSLSYCAVEGGDWWVSVILWLLAGNGMKLNFHYSPFWVGLVHLLGVHSQDKGVKPQRKLR